MYASREQEKKVQKNTFHRYIYEKEKVVLHYDDDKVNHVYMKGYVQPHYKCVVEFYLASSDKRLEHLLRDGSITQYRRTAKVKNCLMSNETFKTKKWNSLHNIGLSNRLNVKLSREVITESHAKKTKWTTLRQLHRDRKQYGNWNDWLKEA